jgi:hypothetical protein
MQFAITALAAFVIVIFVIFPIISTISEKQVYGDYIDESDLDTFFGKYLSSFQLNDSSRDYNLLYTPYTESHAINIPFVAKTKNGKWYINDYGLIRKSSKWTKALNERRAELVEKLPVKNLADL